MARVFTVATPASFCRMESGHVLQKVAFVKHGPQRGSMKTSFVPELKTRKSQSHLVCASVDPAKVSSKDQETKLDLPPPGCSRLKVELNKPLGMVLEEDKDGNIFVAEILENGNAYKSGLIDVGDQLIATSAIVYGTEDFYQGVKVRKGMQIVRLGVYGEKFETVMAAIGTHPAHVKVKLEIQKCQKAANVEENNGASTN